MGRLEQRSRQHTVSTRRAGRPHRRSSSEAHAEVGVRIPQCNHRAGTADRRRRTRVRRQPERHRLRARREDRLHALDVPGEGSRADRHRHRTAKRQRREIDRIFRRRPRERLRARRRHGRAALDAQPRRAPQREHHRHADALSAAPVRADRVERRRTRAEREVRMLHLPRQPRGARRGDGIARVEDVHDQRRGEAGRQERERHDAVGTVGRGHLVVADDRSEAPRRVRGDRQHVHASRSSRRATPSWRSISTAARSNGRRR